MSCEKHPTNVPGWDGTLKELAYELENLRYDKLALFLGKEQRRTGKQERRNSTDA